MTKPENKTDRQNPRLSVHALHTPDIIDELIRRIKTMEAYRFYAVELDAVGKEIDKSRARAVK